MTSFWHWVKISLSPPTQWNVKLRIRNLNVILVRLNLGTLVLLSPNKIEARIYTKNKYLRLIYQISLTAIIGLNRLTTNNASKLNNQLNKNPNTDTIRRMILNDPKKWSRICKTSTQIKLLKKTRQSWDLNRRLKRTSSAQSNLSSISSGR